MSKLPLSHHHQSPDYPTAKTLPSTPFSYPDCFSLASLLFRDTSRRGRLALLLLRPLGRQSLHPRPGHQHQADRFQARSFRGWILDGVEDVLESLSFGGVGPQGWRRVRGLLDSHPGQNGEARFGAAEKG